MPLIAPDIAKRIPKSRRMPMLEGFLYEPRAFWSFGRFNGAAPVGRPSNIVTLDRQHFYNGEKYPITLLYASVCGLNYIFDQYAEAAAPQTAQNIRNCAAAQVDNVQMRFASRQRQHWMKTNHPTQGLIPRPCWEPRASEAGEAAAGVSSLYNVYRWEYDAPMIIPQLGDMEFELGTILDPGAGIGLSNPFATVTIEEIGNGPFGANSRVSDRMVLNTALNPVAWAAEMWPADGFGTSAGQLGGVWTAAQRFRAREYAAQNKSSDGSIPITALNVMLDQRAYDAAVLASLPAAATTALVASIGTRTPTRARMRHGGTGAWWWRPGAPLALVSPHRTTAQVFEFRKPITLGPGDSLEVELIFPRPFAGAQGAVNNINQLGVSFCGYAAIEA